MSLKISRVLHAGYVFEYKAVQIIFDPIFENPFSRNCYAYPTVRFDYAQIRNLRPTAVFISHYHDDHCSVESLNYLDRSTPIYMFCVHPEMFAIISSLGFKTVHSIELNDVISFGDLQITIRRALDSDVDSIFHIQCAGLNILNVVDSWIDDDTLQVLKQGGPWDMILWPFQTMREIEVLTPSRYADSKPQLPTEWLAQLTELNPRVIVPSSCQFIHEDWSWYNQNFFPISYQHFESELNRVLPDTTVLRLNPGVSVEMNSGKFNFSIPLAWVRPVGNQNVDYEFAPSDPIPTTAAIAGKMAIMTENEIDRVYRYCQQELLEKYAMLSIDEESYFKETCLWRLELYDHLGCVKAFHYLIQGSRILSVERNQEPLGWLTELPMAKLYAALELGESLTSMYVRVNDSKLAPEIEDKTKEVDVLEDPLIRCLFDGVFAAYQKSQLQRIKSI